jgi:hypothetical protein
MATGGAESSESAYLSEMELRKSMNRTQALKWLTFMSPRNASRLFHSEA